MKILLNCVFMPLNMKVLHSFPIHLWHTQSISHSLSCPELQGMKFENKINQRKCENMRQILETTECHCHVPCDLGTRAHHDQYSVFVRVMLQFTLITLKMIIPKMERGIRDPATITRRVPSRVSSKQRVGS